MINTTDRTNIHQSPLSSLGAQESNLLDISQTATPCRYRLVSCTQIVEHHILQIDEFIEFPQIEYSVMSYVWRGNSVDPSNLPTTFAVAGAEDADPISIDVLYHACVASLKKQLEYIWMDRLCIMQTNREDKLWQISRMYRMYQSSSRCIILPGGVQRLVRLDEETAWIHRAWTLQECLAPKEVVVLFAWKLGPGGCNCGDEYGTIEDVVSGTSSLTSIGTVVNACVMGYMEFYGAKGELWVQTRVLGATTPNVVALAASMNEALMDDEDARGHAIWQCAWMRTSSRPVDMVFSIMGLFGVILDTRVFQKDDRLSATKALCKEVLRKGGRATWLGISSALPPCKRLSTFPVFPQTSVEGKALLRTKTGLQEIGSVMDNQYPNSLGLNTPMPLGSMDEEGYLTFSRMALRVVRSELEHHQTPEQTILISVDGTAWKPHKNVEEKPELIVEYSRVFVVLLGWFQEYFPGASLKDGRSVISMLIQEHAPGRFHVAGFVMSDIQLGTWMKTWEEHTFSVGGPHPCAASDEATLNIKGNIDKDEEELRQWSPPMKVKMTRRDPKADFALSQSYIESYYNKT